MLLAIYNHYTFLRVKIAKKLFKAISPRLFMLILSTSRLFINSTSKNKHSQYLATDDLTEKKHYRRRVIAIKRKDGKG